MEVTYTLKNTEDRHRVDTLTIKHDNQYHNGEYVTLTIDEHTSIEVKTNELKRAVNSLEVGDA
jgi:stalled ribosome rescue protein Dom34